MRGCFLWKNFRVVSLILNSFTHIFRIHVLFSLKQSLTSIFGFTMDVYFIDSSAMIIKNILCSVIRFSDAVTFLWFEVYSRHYLVIIIYWHMTILGYRSLANWIFIIFECNYTNDSICCMMFVKSSIHYELQRGNITLID